MKCLPVITNVDQEGEEDELRLCDISLPSNSEEDDQKQDYIDKVLA